MGTRGGSGGTGALWWGVGAAGLAGAAMVADRVGKVRRIPAELRSTMAYLPLTYNASNLPLFRAAFARTPPRTIPGVATRGHTIPGRDGSPAVPLLLSERPDRPTGSPALLWIHGGGFVLGSAAASTPSCRQFARDLNVLVVSVDYRLAPECPFPAALDDCYAALTWLHANAARLGIDPTRIAIGGDSSGGGLAACLAQRAHDAGVAVAFQLLLYPMLDDQTCLREPPEGVGELIWTPASNRFGWSSYLGAEPGTASPPPYAAASRRYALAGLPPAWIGVGTRDLFHTEDVTYAERLREAGVDVTLEVVDGFYHCADSLAPNAPQSKLFYASQLEALRRGLGLA